jgi:hypothetical protein
VPTSTRQDQKSIAEELAELKDMLVSYAKQETIDPLKGLSRYIGYGVAGSLALSIGIILLTLSALRAMQTQTDEHLTGNLSWLPYLVAFVVLVILIGLAMLAIRGKDRKR